VVKDVHRQESPTSTNIELSPVWDTSFLAELIYNVIIRQYLCGKCLKPVTIQYFVLSVHNDVKRPRKRNNMVGECKTDVKMPMAG